MPPLWPFRYDHGAMFRAHLFCSSWTKIFQGVEENIPRTLIHGLAHKPGLQNFTERLHFTLLADVFACFRFSIVFLLFLLQFFILPCPSKSWLFHESGELRWHYDYLHNMISVEISWLLKWKSHRILSVSNDQLIES